MVIQRTILIPFLIPSRYRTRKYQNRADIYRIGDVAAQRVDRIKTGHAPARAHVAANRWFPVEIHEFLARGMH